MVTMVVINSLLTAGLGQMAYFTPAVI